MQEKSNNNNNAIPECFRVAVQCSIEENLAHPENYAQEGCWMRHGVAVILGENQGILPSVIPIAPNLTLQTETTELKRKGQSPDLCQSTFHEVWFTHSGLILNAIERCLG